MRASALLSRGAASGRHFASAATTTTHHKKPEAIPPELAGLPLSRPWHVSERKAGSITPTSTTPSSRFYVPSVVLPAETAKSGPVHKIHILGDDGRSRFIAHALCSVYDSVEMLSFRHIPKPRYHYVEKSQPERTRKSTYAEKNLASADKPDKTDKSHIDQLVVTGRGFEAVKAVRSVKDRVDENTSICLLNDGMGVLEQVREEIFKGTRREPNFLLGHMSHALVFNRNRGSVKELKAGRTVLTKADAVLETTKDLHASLDRTDFMRSLQKVTSLRATTSRYDEWLRFKLPSMIFTAAVEPVCVLLEMPYNGLLYNRSAQSMMNKLLDEMSMLVQNLPEVEGSPQLQAFLRGEGLKKFCYRRITGKSMAPSDLLKRVEKGLQTDMNYQNGYFLKRASTLGIDMPTNQMMVQMIRKARLEQLKSQGGGAGGAGGGPSGQQQQQDQQRQQQDEARQHALNQILHPEAADRLGRIRLVKEERANDIENRLITLAQTGQLRQKVTEAQLKELLSAMADNKEEEKIVVSRRKAWDDDDDLDL
ncbi:hypothetical protein FZEAL_4410 [Fusarium zealandicum]|uniref:Ketopantoate reductase N-terminal domain-containing protein n=1 Tax=Fusarium zealandicum TaxID=1053134 RepID=A0A8H4ULS0_9HYPO|nr:hypothetical protein FZEAL_4410 [Fusarium zealandicum]